MTQYDETVERQRLLLLAEEWSTGVKAIHAHSLSSMWYDDHPEHTSEGKCVTDIEYNNGVVERLLSDGTKHLFGKALIGDDLIQAFSQHN
jgi:hypothetical protein